MSSTVQQLREHIREFILNEEAKLVANAYGNTLDEALASAATELNVPIEHIEYELVQKGNSGIFGAGKLPFIIRASVVSEELLRTHTGEYRHVSAEEQASNDGVVTVILTSKYEIMLRVTKPEKNGRAITTTDVMQRIISRTASVVDETQIASIVKKASGQFYKVGEYQHNILNDARVNCILSDDEMRAEVVVVGPALDGMDVTSRQIRAVLKEQGITFGLLDDVISGFDHQPRYNIVVQVAAGIATINGKDAEIVMHYQKEQKEAKEKKRNASKGDELFDYKEILELPNIESGSLIAEKTAPSKGEAGTTVRGGYVPPPVGLDTTLKIGNNVHLSADENQAYASCDGLVRLNRDGIISVDPIYVVNGDINIKTGNIHFLGSVIVRGNIEDGFTIEARGNIRVFGLVGKAVLRAGGSIILHRGIAGKGSAEIISGENILARFIENSYVECTGILAVSDGLVNSTVRSQDSVLCRGKRANIIAGSIMARNYIDAKNIGSSSGSRTTLEVGFDPKTILRLRDLKQMKNQKSRELEAISLNLQTLVSMYKRMQTSGTEIPAERTEQIQQQLQQKRVLDNEMRELDEELLALEHAIETEKVEMPLISVARKVNPGCRITIWNHMLNVRHEFNHISFYSADDAVQVKQYVEPKIEVPDF